MRASAADVCAFYAQRTPVPAGKKTLLVLSIDGKGIVMRPGDLREATRKAAERARRTFRTRLSAGEKTCRKRMATLAVVHDADPAPRRPHDIIAPPGGRTGRRTPRKGPKARQKWLTASVRDDAEQVIAAAFDQAEARAPQHHRCWVVLVDGAAHQLELIQAEAARRKIEIHIVLDIVHVLEKLWAAARCFHTATDPAAEDWVGTKAARILAVTPPQPSQLFAPRPTARACPQISGPQRTKPAATFRTMPPSSTTTRPSTRAGQSPAASSKEQPAI